MTRDERKIWPRRGGTWLRGDHLILSWTRLSYWPNRTAFLWRRTMLGDGHERAQLGKVIALHHVDTIDYPRSMAVGAI
jgi:hypothetical protein